MKRNPHKAKPSPFTGELKPNRGPNHWPGHQRCRTVIDVGAGIRPMQWYKAPVSHVCIEPYEPYAQILESFGYTVALGTAREMLADMQAEGVYMLDVIEHMDRDEALEVIELAKKAATKQVVIYTPLGFMEQDTDNWGLGGDHWQTHRSGWLPGEFPGWSILPHGGRGFYALWQTPADSTRS